MTLEQRIQRRFGRAAVQYKLIEDGDRILVGLSGGKDSLCLLELLARRSHIRRPQFEVEALHVRMENVAYETDTSYLQDFCDRLGVKLHIVTTSIEPPPADANLHEKPMCFLCSWQRRKQFFRVAQEQGFNKIALGHHQDDIIHTALMNLTFQGQFSTMPALLRMRKMLITIIRPLCLETEADIQAYAEQQGYQKQVKHCPYEHESNRTSIQDVFKMMQSLHLDARNSIWNALESAGKLVEY